ncbi:MAG TPA: hypothetical protein VGS13_03935 [Stellaceae bacterium]|nr:hypothetical protein [Stellaceae bacterium]
MTIAIVDGLDALISQEELRAPSDRYKRIAGCSLEELAAASAQPTSSDLLDNKRPGC